MQQSTEIAVVYLCHPGDGTGSEMEVLLLLAPAKSITNKIQTNILVTVNINRYRKNKHSLANIV